MLKNARTEYHNEFEEIGLNRQLGYASPADMVERFPDAKDRLHLLGALDVRGPLFVPDPWGRGPELYAAVYQRIAEALTAAITR